MKFTVLASGSRGNATLIETNGFGLLIDAGLRLDELTARLNHLGRDWQHVDAMLLTHTHGDHWNETVFSQLIRRRMTLYCHAEHAEILLNRTDEFRKLMESNLVTEFPTNEEFSIANALRCFPIPVRHDSGATFGFRLEGEADLFGNVCSIGYASDLGTWDDEVVQRFADVDLLALEYNHDVQMQWNCRRPYRLITRVLGDEGHLSNEQATELVKCILERSESKQIQHLVLLHLSEQCNRPNLALSVAETAFSSITIPVKIHAAAQRRPLATIYVDAVSSPKKKRVSRKKRKTTSLEESWLPGIEKQ